MDLPIKNSYYCNEKIDTSTTFFALIYENMGVEFKGKHEPDEIELLLRKSGKDYCEMCGEAFSGREISIERLERWLEGNEEAICRKCRLLARRRKILIFIITPLIVFLSYLIVKVLT